MNPIDIVNTVSSSIKKQQALIALHEPFFNGHEWEYVKDCLDSGWVSSVGQYVNRFETTLQDYTGVKHAVAVVNGTAALHVSLKLAGVTENDEVLLPALTFVATANAVSYCGAHPHFVDINTNTLGVNAQLLDDYLKDIVELRNGQCFNKNTQRRIQALIAVHILGHPVDLEPLLDICQRYSIVLVEDAAESLGSFYNNRHTGNFGLINATSFNGNKIITTGGGGAILTNNEKLAKHARHITTTAKLPHAWEFIHDQVAYNYRMPNLNAALGLAQLEQLDSFIERKRLLARSYQDHFKDNHEVSVFKEADYARSNYWLNALILNSADIQARDALLQACHDAGLQLRPVWRLLHKLPMYRNTPKMPLTNSERIEASTVCLPSSVSLCEC